MFKVNVLLIKDPQLFFNKFQARCFVFTTNLMKKIVKKNHLCHNHSKEKNDVVARACTRSRSSMQMTDPERQGILIFF